jgi:hypothetical protein
MKKKYVRVSPHAIRYKIITATDIPAGVVGGDWDLAPRRVLLSTTEKFKSVIEHFVEGKPWEETTLFTSIYQRRLDSNGVARDGFRKIQDLTKHYREVYDEMYADMSRQGFVTVIEGKPVSIPHVFVCRDGELALGNNGNHRVPMAQVLDLPYVIVELRTFHPEAPAREYENVKQHDIDGLPELHDGALEVPAMTTLQERVAYYRHAKEQAANGKIVEIGTWLGASTIFIAAGLRDAWAEFNEGEPGEHPKMHAYDRFLWNAKSHSHKAGGPLQVEMIDAFYTNLGPLRKYVETHAGELINAKWTGEPISYLACDGPKRVREISQTFTKFGVHLKPGAITSWQDFAYFPSYDIPACIDLLERAGVLSFVEAVHPGTTVFMRVERQLRAKEVTEARFALEQWNVEHIIPLWLKWSLRLPELARARFLVGASFFLCDRGEKEMAVEHFKFCLSQDKDNAIRKKFDYFIQHRDSYCTKYGALFKALEK